MGVRITKWSSLVFIPNENALDFSNNITLFEIFTFCPKTQLWFLEKIVNLMGWKISENVVVLDFLAVDNFDFTRKNVKKKLGEKLVKMLWFWTF